MSVVIEAEWSSSGEGSLDAVSNVVDGNLNAAGSSTVNWVGSRRRTATCSSGYTYLPPPPPAWAGTLRREPEISVHDVLDDSPNTSSFTDTQEVALGSDVQMDVGTGRLMAGVIQSFDMHPDGDAKQSWVWDTRVVDYIWMLNARRPFGCWNDVSATTVVLALMSQFGPVGYTANHVVAGLPAVTVAFDGSLTFSECLAEIAAQLGGAHFNVDADKDLHFFFNEVTDNPADVTDSNMDISWDQPVTMSQDISQIRNRVFVKGAGAKLLVGASAGATELEIDGKINLFDENGGDAIIGCNRIHYTGLRRTLIYPPAQDAALQPGSGPAVIDHLGLTGHTETGGIKTMVRYSISFVTPDGEGPRSSPRLLVPFRITPSFSINSVSHDAVGFVPVGSHQYKISVVADDGSEYYAQWGVGTSQGVQGSATLQVQITVGANELRLVSVRLYRQATLNGVTDYYTADDTPFLNGMHTLIDTKADASLGNPLPKVPGTASFQIYDNIGTRVWIQASSIAQGPADTVSRRIYREEAYNGPIATQWTDPAVVLTIVGNDIPSGVSPHSSYLEDTKSTTANLYDFGADNPAVLDPAAPPAKPKTRVVLGGVTGLVEDVEEGDEINIFIQRDAPTSQLQCAFREGGSGLHEFYVSDSKLTSTTSLARRGDAELELYSQPIITVNYSTRDPKSTSGKTVNFNLSQPPIVASLKIMESSITQIHAFDRGGNPVTQLYKVTASSLKYTLEDLLRRAVVRGS